MSDEPPIFRLLLQPLPHWTPPLHAELERASERGSLHGSTTLLSTRSFSIGVRAIAASEDAF